MQLKRALFNLCQTSYEEPGWADVGKTAAVGVLALGIYGTACSLAYQLGAVIAKFFIALN